MFAALKRHKARPFPGRSSSRILKTMACSALALCAACTSISAQSNDAPTASPSSAAQLSDYQFVDCSLPGMVVQTGRRNVRQLPSRMVRVTAKRCAIHGGRYIASDRASVEGSLEAWLPQAQAGDPKAQNYVGELFELGLSGTPDYEMARLWYDRAVQKAYAPAMFNLARLFEDGLGGARDREQANTLYYDAMGYEGSLRDKLTEIDSDQLALMRADLAEREAIIAQQETLIARLNSELEALKADRAASSETFLQLEQDLASERLKLANSLSAGAVNRAELQSQLAAIDSQRQAVETRERELAEREAQLNTLQTQISETAAAQSHDQSELIEQLSADLANSREQVSRLRSQREIAVNAEQSALAALSAAETELRSQMTELAASEQALADREAELISLTERYGSESLTLRAEREELQRQRTDMAEARTRFEQQQNTFELRRAELDNRSSELSALEIELTAQRHALTLRSEEFDQAASGVAALADEREELQTRMQGLLQNEAQLQDALQQYQASLSALEARERALLESETQVQSDISIVQYNEQQIEGLARELDAERQRAETAEAALADAQQLLDQMRVMASRGAAIAPSEVSDRPDPPEVPNINFGNYHAILIGNENYEHPLYDDLQTPHEDVDKISEILRTKYGFQTTVLKDAKRLELIQAIEQQTEKMGSQDNLLIYYAGHGVRNAEVGNRAMWIPVDGDPSSEYTAIEFNWIKGFLRESEARKILVVSDSCYSGVILRNAATVLENGTPKEELDYLRVTAKPKTRVAFSSGGVGELALDEGGGNYSVFAAALIKALNNNYEPRMAHSLYQQIRLSVSVQASAQNHEQTPGYGEIFGADHVGGDFIFVPTAIMP